MGHLESKVRQGTARQMGTWETLWGRGRPAVGAHSIVLSVEALLMGDPRGTEQREEEGAEETLRVFRCDIGSRANAASGRRAST